MNGFDATIGSYQKRPVRIQAVRFIDNEDYCNSRHIAEWINSFEGSCNAFVQNGHLRINTLEGQMTAAPGDWIIRGVKGEFYPCKPDIFGNYIDDSHKSTKEMDT